MFKHISVLCIAVLCVSLAACTTQEQAENSDEQGGNMVVDGTQHSEPAIPTLTLAWETEGFEMPESTVYDADRDVIYVSNISGQPTGKDGVGFISRVATDGTIAELKWIEGLNAPKGMAISDGKLYVTDLDRFLAYDIETGELAEEYPAEDAQFINDVAVAPDGRIFVSDMFADRIHVLDGTDWSVFYEGADLENPNGLYVDGDILYIAAWGTITDPSTFGTETAGHLKMIDLTTEPEVVSVGDGTPIGNLDGLEMVGDNWFFVSDWVSGDLRYIDLNGNVAKIMNLGNSSADIGVILEKNMLLVPHMMQGKVSAYTW